MSFINLLINSMQLYGPPANMEETPRGATKEGSLS